MKKYILNIIVLFVVCFGATAQDVNIPDANFKSYLVNNSSINTNGDTEIQVSEANAFTGEIDCPWANIVDLTGIESFTNLTVLKCNNNNLTSLNVEQNTDLTVLVCYGNNLTSLNVNQNTLLTELNCGDNNLGSIDLSQNLALNILAVHNVNLTTLDVTQHTLLEELYCHANSLTTLDVTQNTALKALAVRTNNLIDLDLSQNTALEYLYGWENNLTALDLSQNTALLEIVISNNDLTILNLKNINTTTWLSTTDNPNLTCIEVDDAIAATATWTNIDAQTSFGEDCGYSIPVTSISLQGQGGASTISTLGGTLQMEATILPMNATDPSYTWSVTNISGLAEIDANGMLTALADGTIKVEVAANDGSGVTGSLNNTISNQSSSTAEQRFIKNLSIFPNPTASQLVVDSDSKIDALTILDMMGKTVKTFTDTDNTIDVFDLPKGIYLLQIQVNESLVSKKIIKQ